MAYLGYSIHYYHISSLSKLTEYATERAPGPELILDKNSQKIQPNDIDAVSEPNS
jgi:hypothetical protein